MERRGATPWTHSHDAAPTDSNARANSGLIGPGSAPASACCHFRLHGCRRRPHLGMAMPGLAFGEGAMQSLAAFGGLGRRLQLFITSEQVFASLPGILTPRARPL